MLRQRALAVAGSIAVAGIGVGIVATVASASTSTKPAAVLDRIPAHMLPSGTPVPLPPGIIRVSNDWLVSNGTTLVAVYAGTDGSNPANGRFAIVRQNAQTGQQTVRFVNVPGVHAISIVSAPTGAAAETSAQRGDLEFRTADGGMGKLHLGSDSASIIIK